MFKTIRTDLITFSGISILTMLGAIFLNGGLVSENAFAVMTDNKTGMMMENKTGMMMENKTGMMMENKTG